MIRVAILAERMARVKSLAEMLEEDERLEVTSWSEMRASQADVVLAVEIPLARIPEDGPPVVALGMEADLASLTETVRAVLPSSASDSQIVAALTAAANNLTVLTDRQAKQVLRHSGFDDEAALVEQLTPREMEVLQMLARGLGNKDVAATLGISPHTAKFHVAQILAKLDAASRTEAVSKGIRRGLIPI